MQISKEDLKANLLKLGEGTPERDLLRMRKSGKSNFYTVSDLLIKSKPESRVRLKINTLRDSGQEIYLDLVDLLDLIINIDCMDGDNLREHIEINYTADEFVDIYSDPFKILDFKPIEIINPTIHHYDRLEVPISPYVIFDKILHDETIKKVSYFLPEAYENYKKAQKLKEEIEKESKNDISNEKATKIRGVVYLLKIKGKSQYKIGVTTNLEKRLTQISPKMPFALNVEHKIKSDKIYSLEEKLHNKFKDKHIKGEWFELNKDDVNYIKSL